MVFLLELLDCLFCEIGIINGRVAKILLHPLSRQNLRFLSDGSMSGKGPNPKKSSELAFNVARGLMTSISKLFMKAERVLASATVVGFSCNSGCTNAYLLLNSL